MVSRARYLLLATFIILPLGLYISTRLAQLPTRSFFPTLPGGNVFFQFSNDSQLAVKDSSSMTATKLWNPVRELSRGYGRLPFPIETTDDLPNAHSVVLSCKRNLDYLFFVHTSPDHHLHRKILRGALGKDSLSIAYNWTIVFFVGLSANKDTSRAIEREAALHGDIVVLPYYDTYKNLTYKFVYGMKWVTEYCSGVKYVVKMDDDVVINLAVMMKYLNEVPASQARVFYCQVWEHMPVLRETNSPWYLSKDVYPNKEYSEYCSGMGLVFRSSLLQPLYNATFCLQFHGIDDAFVTGNAALVAGVRHVDIGWLISYEDKDWNEVTAGSIMLCHVQDEMLRNKSWDIIVKNLTSSLQETRTSNSFDNTIVSQNLNAVPT
uniref:Hexosyltransferase n=1 Tax=Ixodes ricinus TaxID=34613 RepID=A0A6B0VCG5_IXORI